MLNSIEELLAAKSLLGYLGAGVLPFEDLTQQSRFMVFMVSTHVYVADEIVTMSTIQISPKYFDSNIYAGRTYLNKSGKCLK